MKIRYKAIIAFVVIAAVIMAWPLLAGVCRVQRVVSPVYSYRYSYAEPVYLKQIAAPYYYSVGTDLQLDALAEKLSARIEQKLVERQRAEEPKPLVVASCAKCHSPGSRAVKESEAPAFFDDSGKLIASAEQRASMRTAAKLGSMPPPPAKYMTDDEYLQLVKELKELP